MPSTVLHFSRNVGLPLRRRRGQGYPYLSLNLKTATLKETTGFFSFQRSHRGHGRANLGKWHFPSRAPPLSPGSNPTSLGSRPSLASHPPPWFHTPLPGLTPISLASHPTPWLYTPLLGLAPAPWAQNPPPRARAPLPGFTSPRWARAPLPGLAPCSLATHPRLGEVS